MKYIGNDELERHWYRYKTEFEPCGQTLERYCWNNKISVRAIENWRRHTKFQNVIPVEVEGIQESGSTQDDDSMQQEPVSGISDHKKDVPQKFISCKHRKAPEDFLSDDVAGVEEGAASPRVRILVNIRMTNGISLFRKNVSYQELYQLVVKLEKLC